MTPIKIGRGEFAAQLDDGRVLSWGWSFRSGRDPFKPAIAATEVTVYARIDEPLVHGGDRKYLVPVTSVGQARLASEAGRIGREALRQRVMPVVRAFVVGATA